MINFDNEQRLFHLNNGNISYYIYINSEGYPEMVYFGEYLENISLDNTRRIPYDTWGIHFYDTSKEEGYETPDKFHRNYHKMECSPYEADDFRKSPIIIKKKDGHKLTSLKYVSYKTYLGTPEYEEYPHATRCDAETLELTLKDEMSDCVIKENISILLDKNIIVKNFEIENKGEDVNVLSALSMQLDFYNSNYRLHHFAGEWAREREEVIIDLKRGQYRVASNFGASSHEENPFVFIENEDEVIGFNLIYSGEFEFVGEVNHYDSLHIAHGMNSDGFDYLLKKNESFFTPQAIISYSNKGIDNMSQTFHKFIKENLITYRHDREYKPVLFNSWEGCLFSFNTESIMSYMDDSKKIGTELFVMDDGWFGHRDMDDSSLGDWYLYESKLDLKKVIDHAHSLDIKFGIWFEPEMISPDSDLYRAHPEYVLGGDRLHKSYERRQFLLDYTNPEVVLNIYNQMIKILDNYDIDYVKWDFNRRLGERFSNYLGKDHQGEVIYRYYKGLYKLMSMITKRYPDMMIEGCSSGGGRFDMGILYFSPQIWTSDEANPTVRMTIQYNTSLGYPLSTVGAHANDYWITSYMTKAKLALFGAYGYEMNPNKLTEDEIKELSIIKDIYKKYHYEVIEEGTLYHIFNPSTSNYMSMESVSKDQSKALVIFMNRNNEKFKPRFIKLKGLKPNAMYKIESVPEKNEWKFETTLSGDNLMKIGISLTSSLLHEYHCDLFIIEEVK